MKQATDQDLQLGKWIGGAALGALVMYMLDPERGAARRALSGEKMRRLGQRGGAVLDKAMQRARTHTGAGNAKGEPHEGGRNVPVAGARARADGHGHGPGDEDHGPGYQRSEQPAWQAARDDYARTSAGRGGARGATLAGAGVLGLAGLVAPRSPIGMAMGLAGLALLVRASGKRAAGSEHARGVEVEKTIRIDAPPEQVFDLFANYENFPRFMSNVLEVRDLGQRRSHWVVKGPAGTHFAWNAVLTEHSRPYRLAWESEPGSQVRQSGAIAFEPLHGGTRVTVRMSYRPPAGAVGHALASLLGSDPRRQMDEDLARMKSLVERCAVMQAGGRNSASDGKFLH